LVSLSGQDRAIRPDIRASEDASFSRTLPVMGLGPERR
jgi:hypothetical protein